MFATIDIGTNSVLLLIGKALPDKNVRIIEDHATVTRIGQNLSKTNLISEESSVRTLDCLIQYSKLCAKHSVTNVAIVGTYALRQAKNSENFLREVKNATGWEIEIISPEREAQLTFNASTHDFGENIIVIDIGGGSTEFICKNNWKSFSIGCVNLTENYIKNDPPNDHEINELRTHVHNLFNLQLDPLSYAHPHDRVFVATAGTATTLMAMKLELRNYSAEKVHGQELKLTDLRNIIDLLKSKSINDRKNLIGLAPERADIILPGALILHEAMSYLGFTSVTISDRGVRYGLFYEKTCTYG